MELQELSIFEEKVSGELEKVIGFWTLSPT
jgi:hypothetical protein